MSTVIDVMMPFYGDPHLLRAAVQSVLGQTSPDWRLTVVDDCYADSGAAAWLSTLGHTQVEYRRNPARLGVSGNFRRCLELTTSRHVVFMGCDDLLAPDYVAVVSEAIGDHPDVAAVQPGVRVIDEGGQPVNTLTDRVKRRLAPRTNAACLAAGEQLAVSLLHGNWAYFPSICWRADLVGAHSFREDMETVLDLDLLLDLVLDDQQVLLLPQVVFSYRRHRHSASAATARSADRFDEESRLFEEIARRCVDRGWHRAARAARWHVASRLHAAVLLPATVGHLDSATTRRLVHHLVERPLH